MTTIENSITARFAAGLTAIMVVATSFTAFAVPAHAATDLEELCEVAQALGISSPEFNALCGGDDGMMMDDMMMAGKEYYVHHPSIDFEFTRNLYIGSRGNDVRVLQQVLNLDSATQVAVAGAGSPGNETEYFGPATRAAVAKFQAANGISPALGYFYPLTREEMNKTAMKEVMVPSEGDDDDDNSGSSSSASGDELEVSEGDNPDDDLMPGGVVRFVVTAFEMEAGDDDVDVEKIIVRFNGDADPDEVIESVVILDENKNIVGDDESLDSDEEADIDVDMTVEEGETVMMYVAVNAASGTAFDQNDGLDFTMDVVEIEASSDVDGLPVGGADMTVQDNIDLGTVALDVDHVGNSSMEIGSEDELVVTVEVDANPDDTDDSVYVKNFRLKNNGSGDLDDLANVYVEVDGEEYEGSIDPSDDDYLVFDFGDGFELEDGDREDFEVSADFIGGSGDTFLFVIDEASDFYAEAENGYGMPVTGSLADTNTSDDINVSAGTGRLSKSTDEDADEITVGDEVVVGYFDFDIEGEGFQADRLTMTMVISNGKWVQGGSTNSLEWEDVYLADSEGNRLSDKEDASVVFSNTTNGSVAGTSTVEWDDIEFPEGDHEDLQIIANIDDEVDNGTRFLIQDFTSASFNDPEGVDSDEDVTISGTASFENRTVEAALLEFSVESGEPDDSTTSNEVDGFHMATIEFDARSSGEDIVVTSFEANLNFTATTSSDIEEIDNCRLYEEDGGDEIELDDEVDGKTGVVEYDFDLKDDLMIPADEQVKVEIRCDLGDDLVNGSTFTWSVDSTTSDVDAEGDSTGNDNITTITNSTSSLVTIQAATITLAKDSNSPDAQVVELGEDDVVLGMLEIEADNGDATIEKVTVQLSDFDVVDNGRVYVYLNGNEEESVDLTGNASDGVIDNLSIDVEDGEEVVLELRGDIDSSTVYAGSSTVLTVTSITLDDNTVVSGPVAFDSVTAFEAVPEIDLVSDSTNELEASQVNYELFEFSVKAEGDDLFVDSVALDFTNFSNINQFTGELYVYQNASHSNEYGTDNEATSTVSSTGVVTFTFPTDIKIDEGDTFYFVLEGDVTASNDPATITIELREDAAGVQFLSAIGGSNTIDSQAVLNDDLTVTHSYTN